jgi:hypothetical protein
MGKDLHHYGLQSPDAKPQFNPAIITFTFGLQYVKLVRIQLFE